jgi:hypothetical protein
MSNLKVASFGGGVNSTAMLIGMWERGERPDLILFADTGGEKASTYRHVEEMAAWCLSVGFPAIETVHNAKRPNGDKAPHQSLEEECHTNKTLPSLAYGFKGCSSKWKHAPLDRHVVAYQPAQEAFTRGEKVERLIGIDAGERHRSAALVETVNRRWIYRRPLVDWDWGREECVEAIERVGIQVPEKSACWFCPAMKKHEVLRLAREEPQLFQRAVDMEHNAAPTLGTVRGLGRNWSWEEIVKADDAQLKLFPEATDEACLCFDGDED